MTRIEITVDDAEVREALARLRAAAEDMTPAMSEIGAAMLFATQRRFEREAGPDGRPWPPLSRRYARRRRGGAGNMLRLTNRLYSSLTWSAGRDEVAWGTNVPYAGVHQFGGAITHYARSQIARFRKVKGRSLFARKTHKRATSRPITIGQHTVRIPARPFLGVDERDRATIAEIVADHLRRLGGAT